MAITINDGGNVVRAPEVAQLYKAPKEHVCKKNDQFAATRVPAYRGV